LGLRPVWLPRAAAHQRLASPGPAGPGGQTCPAQIVVQNSGSGAARGPGGDRHSYPGVMVSTEDQECEAAGQSADLPDAVSTEPRSRRHHDRHHSSQGAQAAPHLTSVAAPGEPAEDVAARPSAVGKAVRFAAAKFRPTILPPTLLVRPTL